MRMKKIGIILIGSIVLGSCGESKTPLEEIVEKRCECLKHFDQEKNNFIDLANCLDKVNEDEKYKELGEEEIMELMKKNCPDAILPERKQIEN